MSLTFQFLDEYNLPSKIAECYKDENGKMHSIDGRLACRLLDGTRLWMKHGQLHNIDAPAITFPNGDELWIQDGKLHREDGPALVSGNCLYYEHGQKICKYKKRL
jgi:hypothetical protein